jgi:hypothetical protein
VPRRSESVDTATDNESSLAAARRPAGASSESSAAAYAATRSVESPRRNRASCTAIAAMRRTPIGAKRDSL